ncbi:unnamed protein product [Ceutorhynchus assimilis]|uniref:Uncharacterized protein n=1 Tax=Ceutorhynchus assimilis TaxID=467358 RepID=A0A9N9MQ40_9CUCU|nr:unnamed protein product [Ceutorhynchus assimilis]
MASDSVTSFPINEHSDSSAWSSDTENLQRQNEPKKFISKLSTEEKRALSPVTKKKKKAISVCLSHSRYEVIKKTAQKFGFKEVCDGESWNLYWTDLSITVERCKEMKRFQKINHFPGMLEICRKDLLARNLTRMQRMFPRDYNFFPKTWCFPADLGDAINYSKIRRNKTFILKPDAGSQGRGIIITKSLKDIRPYDRGICQVYIAKPMLIDGYKFDLRVYTLITSCEPLRIYIYDEGLVRFATSQYKEPNGVNITNVFMHLTNYAVNKHSRTYNQDIHGNGSKRKLTWLQSYWKALKYDVNAIWHKIDDVIIKTIISAYPVLKHSYAACFPSHDVIPACCELLGVDIMFDKKMCPLVLEVNHSPSFHTDTPLDTEVKEALISDMFSMMNLEKCDKRRIMREDRKRIRERLLHGNKDKDFQVIDSSKNLTEYFKSENSNKGGFRLVYPTSASDHLYGKFFDQGQNTLYSDTVSSRAREAAQSALRGEMVLRQKLEASKRVTSTKTDPINQTSGRSIYKTKRMTPSLNMPSNRNCSYLPQQIIESEEKERLKRLAQRDYLLRSHGILEHVYFSLKKNKALRPQDDRKYAIFEKMRSAAQVINIPAKNGPVISDMLDGLQGYQHKGEGENMGVRNDIIKDWALFNSKPQTSEVIYTELDNSGNANIKYSQFSSSLKL